ncbi:MAG: hypothetical protein KUG59_04855 [Parvibaculaceae bacterium]|nr:hypothetical protein [Parvibaculaceae bacterium]
MENLRDQHLNKFYDLLSMLEKKLGGVRKLGECHGRMDWPQRGIYFFQEFGETRSGTGNENRIVRVGTHALKFGSKTKLWSRLSQHKGVMKSGGGNHRGSIFRLIAGVSLIERDGLDFPTWNQGNSAPREIREREHSLEQAVSRVIGEMPFLWLPINDAPGPESQRGYIERNAIALLSNFDKAPLDPASTSWLGHSCNRERVRKSGLWNSNHVHEVYNPAFLGALEVLITQMETET